MSVPAHCRGRRICRPGTQAPRRGALCCGRILSAPTTAAAEPPTGRHARRPLQLTYTNRFLSGTLPGGAGNQRIGTEDVASLSGGTAAAGGFYPPLQGVAKTIGLQQPAGHTPSVSPFGLPAPSEREPRALRACGRVGAPTYPYKTRSVIKNLRFLCCPLPGGSGHQRIRTKPVAL